MYTVPPGVGEMRMQYAEVRRSRWRREYIAALVCVLLFAGAARLPAQGSGRLIGTVTDPTGAAIPMSTVTVTEVGTNLPRTAVTNQEGYYVLPSLRPSRYLMVVTVTGFRESRQPELTLLADQSLTVNVKLELGPTSETVSVVGSAVQVDTTTPTLRQVIDQQRLVDLPLNGRNAAQLTLLVPGAVTTPSGGADQGITKTFPGAVTISTNGSRQNQISYNLDGAKYVDEYTNVNQPFPFPDVLQEFSVQTSNYAAQYGQNAGAVVNVITKSGTNELHGNLFGFLRNKEINARNFFQAQRDDLKRTQFGFTAGGPVKLPGYDGKDRTFFFGGFQGTRIRSIQRGLNAFVPTQANRGGDFSALLDARSPENPLGRAVQVLDPVTRTPFVGNQIPVSRFDPAAINFLRYLPIAGGNGRIQFDRPLRQDFNEGLIKADHSFGSNDRLSLRYLMNNFDNASTYDGSNLLTLTNYASIRFQNALVHHTHIFSPNLLNDLRISYARTSAGRGQPEGVPTLVDFGVRGLYQSPDSALERVNATGFFSTGTFPVALFIRNNFSFANDLKWVRGRHSFGFGGVIDRSRVDVDNRALSNGRFVFTNDITNFALASLLIGKVRTFEQGAGEYRDLRVTIGSLYAQDSIRLNSRLTLDLGVRWDPYTPWHEIRGRYEIFRPDAYARGEQSKAFINAPPGLFFPFYGDPGPKHATNSNWNNIAPRLGFAYDVFGNGRTSIRGGSGIFYDQRLNGLLSVTMSDVSPFSPQIFVTDPAGSFSDPLLGLSNPFPAPFPPPPDAAFPRPVIVQAFSPAPKFHSSTLYQWNLAIEQQLPSGWLMRLAYVGSHGSHLKGANNLNNAINIAGSTLSTDQRRRFQGYSDILVDTREGNSIYNSLQVSGERRFTQGPQMLRGLTILANYTFSKSIDNLPESDTIGIASLHTRPFDDPLRMVFDRGLSEYDRKHRVVVSYVWQLPQMRNANAALRTVLGDWQATGIFQAQSGTPFTIFAGRDQSRTGLNRDRGVYSGDPVTGAGGCGATEAPCVNFLNPAAFTLPGVGEFGNVGKAAIRGPNLWTWDMGFFKDIPFAERYRVQFRFEYFNIFNRTNLNNPTATVSAGGFGGIRSASDPRIGQVGVKILF